MTLTDKLIKKNYKISFAESATGGALCAKLVTAPNTSKVLEKSFVLYSNQAKIDFGVSIQTIENFGVVSLETAIEMVN